MRSRVIVGLFIVMGLLAAGTLASSGDGVAPQKQWALVNFIEPVRVGEVMLMGPYLIVHDEARMARGEPCTTLYKFDAKRGPRETVLSFVCLPFERHLVEKTTLTTLPSMSANDVPVLAEYQFAGDIEGHGVPITGR
jgi:hypothetical protein